MLKEDRRKLAEKLITYFSSVAEPDYRSRRMDVESMKGMRTWDVRRLQEKLVDPQVMLLGSKGLDVAAEEAITILRTYDPKEVSFEAGLLQNIDDRETLYYDLSQNRQSLETLYSYSRLDILWDMAWSMYLWPPNTFGPNFVRLYRSLMGDRELLDLPPKFPFQFLLTAERKRRLNRAESHLYTCAKRAGLNDLLEMGLSEDLAMHAIEWVSLSQQTII
jgi:hypothetical protein